jgi:hypothetical protein
MPNSPKILQDQKAALAVARLAHHPAVEEDRDCWLTRIRCLWVELQALARTP